jgi:dTDP-4-amino-4,6-dideoxygalactose transaminase
MKTLAALGGPPAFADGLPFVRPPCPPLSRVVARLEPSYTAGVLTNGPLVRELEDRSADRLGVRSVVAVSSCTAGLMLAVRALVPSGDVVVPSFTFSASAHAISWNGSKPLFVECDPRTFQVDTDHVASLTPSARGLMGTHVFGAPCDVDELERLAHQAAVPLILDAAHAFGATSRNRPVGRFGDAEVFSLSPTKVLVGGEGGLVATNRADVADAIKLGRDYGNPGDYDTRFVGLNARMSELHAAIALESLDDLDDHLDRRRAIAARYRAGLSDVPGLALQSVAASDRSTYKDLTIVLDGDFGLDRDGLRRVLGAERIDTRSYFSPPVHLQQAYRSADTPGLPVTESVSDRVLSLPIHRELPLDAVDAVVESVLAAHRHAEELAALMRDLGPASARAPQLTAPAR